MPQNINKAISCYQAAAKAGLDIAQYNLGICHECGQGRFPKNPEMAYTNFMIAASQEFGQASYELGRMHECGIYVPRNIDMAIEHYNEAVKNGFENAAKHASRLLQLKASLQAKKRFRTTFKKEETHPYQI